MTFCIRNLEFLSFSAFEAYEEIFGHRFQYCPSSFNVSQPVFHHTRRVFNKIYLVSGPPDALI